MMTVEEYWDWVDYTEPCVDAIRCASNIIPNRRRYGLINEWFKREANRERVDWHDAARHRGR